jgi:hypothetical protein
LRQKVDCKKAETSAILAGFAAKGPFAPVMTLDAALCAGQ